MYENTQQGTAPGSSALPTSIHRMIEGFYLYNIDCPLLFLFEIGGCGLLSWLFTEKNSKWLLWKRSWINQKNPLAESLMTMQFILSIDKAL